MFTERYEIVDGPLDGGMGSVYKCKDSSLSRHVAIKVIQDAQYERRIVDEINALLKLRSKHVVQVLDLLPIQGGRAIVQEFIEGTDLWDADAHPTGTEETYQYLWQIASGIADIHSAGVIHRDIKPNNMKVDLEGVIKIFDFGLARNEGIDASTLGFAGTFGFAAPELFLRPALFTAAVDVFAFGATAIHLIAGGLPGYMRVPAPPQPLPEGYLTQFNSGLANEVLLAIEACMRINPLERPSWTTSEVY